MWWCNVETVVTEELKQTLNFSFSGQISKEIGQEVAENLIELSWWIGIFLMWDLMLFLLCHNPSWKLAKHGRMHKPGSEFLSSCPMVNLLLQHTDLEHFVEHLGLSSKTHIVLYFLGETWGSAGVTARAVMYSLDDDEGIFLGSLLKWQMF